MPNDPQKINVVISGSPDAQVVYPSANTINLNQTSSTVNVTQSSSSSSVSSTPESNINVGFMGIQGIAGSAVTAPGAALDGEVLYNENGYVSGARGFFYNKGASEIKISGNNLLLTSGSTAVLSGTTDESAFLLRDANADLLKVDTKNKKILLSNNTSSTQYRIGIGGDTPREKVHISGGNLRVDGNMLVSGNILPLKSGEFNLGSPTFPFKDVYLHGDSIVFVDKDSKITASNTGFSFQVTNAEGVTREIGSITTENVGIFKGDGSGLTGVKYSGLQDAGAFIQQVVPSGSEKVTVDYGKTLNYDPAVICALTSPTGNNNAYFTHVESISRTGCKALFSENIDGNGFILNSHISPINPVF